MNSTDGLLFKLVVTLLLVAIGFTFGRINEARHLRALAKREPTLRSIQLHSKRFDVQGSDGVLVIGSAVIAQDYFKMALSYLLSLFGKPLTPFESLLERARREAMLRMKQQAAEMGSSEIYGFRLEVTSINDLGSMVEAIAYGTAVKPRTE